MNKQEKQVLQAQIDSERETLNKLKDTYKKALDDINERVAILEGREDTENLQSIIYQKQYQEALKQQISGILDTLNGEQFSTVSEYLVKSYEDGFVGTVYNLHGQGIPLVLPIDEEQVIQAVNLESKLSTPLYSKLGEDVEALKLNVSSNISRGMAQGMSYAAISRNVTNAMVGNYQKMNGGALAKAMRITRTESHRISNRASFNACFTAKSKGANIVKQWDATLDGRTRSSHRIVDGEIAELEEKFSNGLLYPGDPSGSAAEVVNCRCALLQRAKWALDKDELDRLQERAKFFGLDKNDSFKEFKTKYLRELDNNGNHNYHNDKLFKVNRKKSNFGAFSNLKIPMQKKEVLKISKKI